MTDRVFQVEPSVENDRPCIDFESESNSRIDWAHVDAVLSDPKATALTLSNLNIEVEHANAASWDFYSVPGVLGLVSNRAIGAIGAPAFRHFDLVEVGLNNQLYFLLKAKSRIDCLDHERSKIVHFREKPNRIKNIVEFVFNKESLEPHIFFSIPELDYRIFATSGVVLAIQKNGLNGFSTLLVD